MDALAGGRGGKGAAGWGVTESDNRDDEDVGGWVAARGGTGTTTAGAVALAVNGDGDSTEGPPPAAAAAVDEVSAGTGVGTHGELAATASGATLPEGGTADATPAAGAVLVRVTAMTMAEIASRVPTAAAPMTTRGIGGATRGGRGTSPTTVGSIVPVGTVPSAAEPEP